MNTEIVKLRTKSVQQEDNEDVKFGFESRSANLVAILYSRQV